MVDTLNNMIRYILRHLPWGILGPLTFLLVAVCLVPFCPDDKKGELIFLIAGAALTRVKFAPLIEAPQVAPVEEPDPADETEKK